MNQQEEQIIVNQILDGDIQLFELIVDNFKERIINVCFSYTNNLTDAEDISQEVFIEVFKSLQQFKKQSSLSTWMYRIASNKSIDYIRMKKRLKRGVSQTFYLEDQKNIEAVIDNDPLDELIQEQRKEFLYFGLAKINDRQKRAFVLTQIEGFDHKTAADIMDTSVKSIESLVIRSKKKLKSLLKKQIREYL